MFDAPAPTPASCIPPPETRAERRMRRLEQMAEQGVELGRLLTEQAEFAAACAATDAVPDNLPHADLLNEIARSHAQVTRAVALASAVEDRIEKGLPALPEVDRARRMREDACAGKREAAASAVERAMDGDRSISRRRHVHLRLDLRRLLDRETVDLDRFLARPLPEVIARLHRDLGLEPRDELEVWTGGEANATLSLEPEPHGGGGAHTTAAARKSPQSRPSKPGSAFPLHPRQRSPSSRSRPRSGNAERISPAAPP